MKKEYVLESIVEELQEIYGYIPKEVLVGIIEPYLMKRGFRSRDEMIRHIKTVLEL